MSPYGNRQMHSDLIFNINIMSMITIFTDSVTLHHVFPRLGMQMATSHQDHILNNTHAFRVFSSMAPTSEKSAGASTPPLPEVQLWTSANSRLQWSPLYNTCPPPPPNEDRLSPARPLERATLRTMTIIIIIVITTPHRSERSATLSMCFSVVRLTVCV